MTIFCCLYKMKWKIQHFNNLIVFLVILKAGPIWVDSEIRESSATTGEPIANVGKRNVDFQKISSGIMNLFSVLPQGSTPSPGVGPEPVTTRNQGAIKKLQSVITLLNETDDYAADDYDHK